MRESGREEPRESGPGPRTIASRTISHISQPRACAAPGPPHKRLARPLSWMSRRRWLDRIQPMNLAGRLLSPLTLSLMPGDLLAQSRPVESKALFGSISGIVLD